MPCVIDSKETTSSNSYRQFITHGAVTAVFASGPPVPQTSRGDVEPAREYTAHIEVHVTAEETLNPMMKPLVNMPCPTSAPGEVSETKLSSNLETSSLASKNMCCANNLEKVVWTKLVIKCVKMPWRMASPHLVGMTEADGEVRRKRNQLQARRGGAS